MDPDCAGTSTSDNAFETPPPVARPRQYARAFDAAEPSRRRVPPRARRAKNTSRELRASATRPVDHAPPGVWRGRADRLRLGARQRGELAPEARRARAVLQTQAQR